MAAPDNTLGAPTEGLGQKVTFAFQNGSGAPVQSFQDIGRIRADVRGGGTAGGSTRATSIPVVQESPTMQVLTKIAGQAVSVKLQQAKTEAFVTGMQRAMAGEAVADIARDQPWYSKLFGDTDVVEGARAYAGQAVAQTAIGAMEDKMQGVRKLGPQEAQQFFVKSVNEHLTGDKATDASVLQAFSRALPQVMRRQAKEHYGFLQENAVAEETAAFNAGATTLQKTGRALGAGDKDGTVTKDEFAAMARQFVGSQVPAAGMDLQNWKTRQKERLAGLAKSGQFHALNAMRDSGFFDVLDPEQLSAVESAVESGQSLVVRKYSGAWNNEMAEIETMASIQETGQTTGQLQGRIDAMNAKFIAETGSRQGLISPDQRAALLSRSQSNIIREHRRQVERFQEKNWSDQRAARSDEAKALLERKQNEFLARYAEGGLLGVIADMPGIGAAKAHAMGAQGFLDKQDPNNPGIVSDKQLDYLRTNVRSNFVINGVRDSLAGQVRDAAASGEPGPQFANALTNYIRVRDTLGPDGAAAYYGSDMGTKMEYLYSARRTGGEGAIIGAFRQAFVNGIVPKSPPSKAEITALASSAGRQGFWDHHFGGKQNPTDYSLGRIAADLQYEVGQRMAANGGNAEEAFAVAFKQRRLNGELEVAGGHYIPIAGKGRQGVIDYLKKNPGPDEQNPLTKDNVHDVFAAAVSQALREIGVDDAAMAQIDRMADTKEKVPVIQIMVVKDGDVKRTVLEMKDVYKKAAKLREAEEAARTSPGPTGMTTPKSPMSPAIPSTRPGWATDITDKRK